MFEGRSVVVTGGASGIGAAACRAFATQGAQVAVVDIDGDGAAAVADGIGAAATAYAADVTEADQVAAMAEAVLAASGGVVDVVVNNVGHYGGLAHGAREMRAHVVAFNHGTHPVEAYAEHADLLGTFEGPWRVYLDLAVPRWTRTVATATPR